MSKSLDQQGTFTQWVSDNVDHNICTLTGRGTFHGMGTMAVSSKSEKRVASIKRLKNKQFSGITNDIEILPFYGSSQRGLMKLIFDIKRNILDETVDRSEKLLDIVWQTAWFFSSNDFPRPNWQGYMQSATAYHEAIHKDSVKFLPIIDLNPSDETCIFSTLNFIIDQAKNLGVDVPCVTFDQPLWQKAVGIIMDQNLHIVCRLGGFHTLMSFLGSIGKLMTGSGLEELFEEVYAEHTVKHMIFGKAVARSLRAHLMTQSVLVGHLIEILVEEKKIDATEFEPLYGKMIAGDMPSDELAELQHSPIILNYNQEIQALTSKLRKTSRTAQLWLQYIEYIDIVKEFIFAERTSNWELHLRSIYKMINLFAATGHVNYARSSRMYHQQMSALKHSYPYLYHQFKNGNHAVRRSQRYWAGLWSDLVIEQTLMRSIKSQGGLTRGKGMKANVRHLWVSSLHYTAGVHEAMTSLTGIKNVSSEQHKEMSTGRKKVDFSDATKFYQWFEIRNPFTCKSSDLYSLSNGTVSISGKDKVNCENAEIIGENIQKGLDGIAFTNAKIRRKDQVQPLASLKKTTKIDEKTSIHINSSCLFTRLAAVAQREKNVEQYFEFELTQFPESLFKHGLMRKPDKASLRRSLLPDEKNCVITLESVYVLDGGALLHRVFWNKRLKFGEIIKDYVNYVRKNYGLCYVVFDGYDDPTSTKSSEHKRRKLTNGSSQDIIINIENEVPCSKERFLSNSNNKKQLISLLSAAFQRDGQQVYECKGDADTKIVSTALKVSKTSKTTVVADDTDVAVMLLYHWKPTLYPVFFLQERGKKCWNIGDCKSDIGEIGEHLLFIHVWTGCDSTSAINGKGKPSFIKAIKKSIVLRLASEKLSDYWAKHKEIGEASVEAFKEMYGTNSQTSLSQLR